MKIGLLGYGRMGKEIEKIALSRGHEIVFTVGEHTQHYEVKLADVVIEFSIPKVAPNHLCHCFEHGVPVVCGTTGWLDQFDEMTSLCRQNKGGFIYASNYSLGVNVFFELNDYLSRLMANVADYTAEVEEIHHKQKLDEPSGTAITLAQSVIANHPHYQRWALDSASSDEELPVRAIRSPKITGTHTVSYRSDIDGITINHEAYNRKGFALGAVVAAEWLRDKQGVFTMKDVLGIYKK